VGSTTSPPCAFPIKWAVNADVKTIHADQVMITDDNDAESLMRCVDLDSPFAIAEGSRREGRVGQRQRSTEEHFERSMTNNQWLFLIDYRGFPRASSNFLLRPFENTCCLHPTTICATKTV